MHVKMLVVDIVFILGPPSFDIDETETLKSEGHSLVAFLIIVAIVFLRRYYF